MEVHTYNPSYLGRQKQNCLNPGGGGCSELRLLHCTPAWSTRVKLHLKKKKKQKKTRLGAVDHPYHPTTLEGQDQWII